jgi:hypothetical protein
VGRRALRRRGTTIVSCLIRGETEVSNRHSWLPILSVGGCAEQARGSCLTATTDMPRTGPCMRRASPGEGRRPTLGTASTRHQMSLWITL